MDLWEADPQLLPDPQMGMSFKHTKLRTLSGSPD